MDQSGEVGLRVPESVSPIFESLHAGRLCTDEGVADRSVSTIGPDGVEESGIGVLVYRECSAFDGGCEWFRCHGLSYFLSFGVVVSRISSMSSSPFLVSCHLQHGLFRSLMPLMSTRRTYQDRTRTNMRLLWL